MPYSPRGSGYRSGGEPNERRGDSQAEKGQTRHKRIPHCEDPARQCFRDLEGFVGSISSEHAVVVYVNLIPALGMAAGVIGLETRVI